MLIIMMSHYWDNHRTWEFFWLGLVVVINSAESIIYN